MMVVPEVMQGGWGKLWMTCKICGETRFLIVHESEHRRLREGRALYLFCSRCRAHGLLGRGRFRFADRRDVAQAILTGGSGEDSGTS